METPTLILGKSEDILPALPAGSINLIAADLPYGITNADWDKVLDYGWMWAQYERLLKPNGAVVLTASQPFTSQLVVSRLDWFKYELIWRKNTTTGFPNARYIPLKQHENVLVFSPAPARSRSSRNTMTYNPQGLQEYGRVRKAGKKKSAVNSELKAGWYTAKSKNFPRSVLDIYSERGYHPTQKPEALMDWIVLTYSNPGEVVLDNCMGSGTTGVSAVRHGRRFIGIEMLKEFYDIAVRRIYTVVNYKDSTYGRNPKAGT